MFIGFEIFIFYNHKVQKHDKDKYYTMKSFTILKINKVQKHHYSNQTF
jgi:hypothetical protein